MITPKFQGILHKGQIILDDQNLYDIYLPTLEGQRIELVIQKEQKEKTNQQLKYLYGVVFRLISNETGYTKEEVENMMRYKFLKIQHESYVEIKSISSLKTKEASDFINEVKMWASMELGLYIPDANKTKYN